MENNSTMKSKNRDKERKNIEPNRKTMKNGKITEAKQRDKN